MAGLFARPAGVGGGERDSQTQTVFLRFQVVCVPLLDAARQPPVAATTRTIIDLLNKLTSLIEEAPDGLFTPALANYAFFPLASLLQPALGGADRGDLVLEAAASTLAALVPRWRDAGMEQRVRQELWIMVALKLGGPLDPKAPKHAGRVDKGKGKAVERTEEASLSLVRVLLALMQPTAKEKASLGHDGEEDALGENIDWNKVDPLNSSTFAEPPAVDDDRPPPVPILFHTLTTLLTLAADPASLLQLQLSSLKALNVLFAFYLSRHDLSPAPAPSSGPSPLLVTALPGSASTLSRIAVSKPSSSQQADQNHRRRQAIAVVVAALECLARLVVHTVGDGVTRDLRGEAGHLGEAQPASLEDLAELDLLDDSRADEMNEGGDEAGPSTSAQLPAPPTGPTIPTASWLRFTVCSLSTLFSALSPLASHDSPTVRVALVDFLSNTISRCGQTLGEAAEGPLEGLLLLASDEWDDVRGPARRALLVAFTQPAGDSQDLRHPLALAARIVRRRLTALPRSLRQRDEQAVGHGAGIVRSALELLPTFQARDTGAGALEGIDRWSWTLFDAMELERVPAAGRAVESGMALAWITGADATDSSEPATAFPPIRLRGINESATVVSLDSLWQALGRMAASSERLGDVVEQLLGAALGPRRGESAAVTSLWVLDGILRGARVDQVAKANKKVLRHTVRGLLSLLDELEELEAVDGPAEDAALRDDVAVETLEVAEPDEASPQLILHKAGAIETPSLNAYKPVASVSSTQEARASHRLLLQSLALRLLATAATLLGSSFQPFLMQALYHVLAHLSPTAHPLLRAHARATLQAVSDSTAYASPQNLVLSNVDYVVNSVSQRLSVSRLEPSAPLVLVEMIRLVGKPIVPMVHDLVDDVFEALDDFHGYDEITVGLWAVLDALLKVMEEDLPPPQDQQAKHSALADADSDWRAFEEWYRIRHDQAKDDEDDVADINPQRPFESGFKSHKEREDGPAEFPSDTVTPPTRPQVVTAQILSKAMYFLSHQSPFLRARVLSLVASAVPLLARPDLEATTAAGARASDLLPVIHRAWPFVLNRLADHELFVVVEAASLIESLASHVGEFLARRILDDVWPRFRTLMAKQELEDRKSAIAGSTRYSSSHRLYRSILRTLLRVARDVPLKEEVLWEQAVLARRFLGAKVDAELQVCASDLYKALGQINLDAVWLVLAGTVGLHASLPAHLHMPNVDFGSSIDLLLEQM
ncbi:armadillo-type fold domain containing protein [Rhodotorula toruloides]|uniref:Armadillo-type fold domain containing protein n=1 Tax=Rhodotorula toruloides TaxID=5286 RepID=A0A511KBC3_RHOTO|nr:armadillo-type fold domain containing protein [Rhodotorula toruloides]